MLRCRPQPQFCTVAGDTSVCVCVKLDCGILAMMDYYTGAAKCQGGIIQDRKIGGFHNGGNKQS